MSDVRVVFLILLIFFVGLFMGLFFGISLNKTNVVYEDSWVAGYFSGIVKTKAISPEFKYCSLGIYSKELCDCAVEYNKPENFKKYCMPLYDKMFEVLK